MKKIVFAFLLFAFNSNIYSQEINIIPKPVSIGISKISTEKRPFIIDQNTIIAVSEKVDQNVAEYLKNYIETYYNLKLRIVYQKIIKNKANSIILINAEDHGSQVNISLLHLLIMLPHQVQLMKVYFMLFKQSFSSCLQQVN